MIKSVYPLKFSFVKQHDRPLTMSLQVEFHCHSWSSKDSLTSPSSIVRMGRRRGLDRIVVTDHNTISGARAAQELDPELIIVGEEIMTTQGEILAAFVSEEVPRGLAPRETIHRLREQGAFVSVSHPFDSWRSGAWRRADLLELVPELDAIEVFNARCLRAKDNALARAFARQQGLAGTAGSDAHHPSEIGSARLVVAEFRDAQGLRGVIEHAVVRGRLSPFWVHFLSTYARWKKRVV